MFLLLFENVLLRGSVQEFFSGASPNFIVKSIGNNITEGVIGVAWPISDAASNMTESITKNGGDMVSNVTESVSKHGGNTIVGSIKEGTHGIAEILNAKANIIAEKRGYKYMQQKTPVINNVINVPQAGYGFPLY